MSNNQTATLAGGIVGGAIGAYFGQPALGFSVGSALGNALVPPQVPDLIGGQLQDLAVTSTTFGTPIPLLWGTNRVSGQLIFSSGKKETEIETEVGSKGGPTQTQYTYTYSLDAAYSLGRLPPSAAGMAVRKIWINSLLVYDVSETSNAISLEKSTKLAAATTVYDGSETQLPSSLQESYKGVGNVPAYREHCILEFEDLQLAQFGNGTVSITAEVVVDPPAVTGPVSVNTWSGGWSPSASYDNGTIVTAHAENIAPTSIDSWEQVVRRYDMLGNLLTERRKLIDWGPFSSSIAYPRFGSNEQMLVATQTSFNSIIRLSKFDALAEKGFSTNQSHPFNNNNWEAWGLYNDTNTWLRWGDYYYVIGGTHNVSTSTPLFLGRYPIIKDVSSPYVGYPQLDPDIAINIGTGALYGATNRTLSLDTKNQRLYFYAIYSGNSHLTSWSPELELITHWQSPAVTFPTPLTGGRLTMFSGNKALAKNQVGTTNVVHLYEFDPDIDNSSFTQIKQTSLTGSTTYTDVRPLTDTLVLTRTDLVSIEPPVEQTTVPIADIISDFLTLTGADPGDYDVSGLTDTVDGYKADKLISARRGIEPIMKAYFIDAVEVDNKIKFVKRGGASVKTIGDDDLIRVNDALITVKRGSELELPKRVTFAYINKGADYQVNEQHKDRLVTTGAVGISNVAIPVAMDDDTAAQIADAMLYSVWIERDSVIAYVSTKNIELVPTDIITLGSAGLRVRLTDVDTKLIGAIKLTGVIDYADSYLSGVTGGNAIAASTMAGLEGPSILQLLDIPIMRDQDEGFIKYAGLSGVLDGWGGGLIYRSQDAGATYTENAQLLTSTVFGYTTNTLADGPTTTWDDDSTLIVGIANGELASATDLAVMNGANVAAIGDHGRWEIVQWTTATPSGGGVYTLSRLLRGRRGTEHNTANHLESDRVIILSATTLARLDELAADLDQNYVYKGVSIGNNIQDAQAEIFANEGQSITPFSPVYILGSRDGSNNLTTTFKRRDRMGYRANYTLPLSEDSQSYELEYWNTADTVQYGGTKTATTQTHSYTAAQQTTDGATPGQAFLVKIYQISAVIGRGHEGAEII